ncbi:Uma2 family endonuclease [Niabella pedocola]|uniref:Uma2 family endonuclease n=1 Tax=Niabella pedocola TaxID=1752077 RepID=A0ABS8PQ19_9BACT|nr:Uma2 family endonuclease [Niabella pedocola]MCD2422935.1 Uma2 family endonuclease [Niabella pedocola]
MAYAQKILPHYTYDDWVHWEGRWELIDGIPIAMSPMPQPRHQRVAAEIRYAFMNTLKATSCQRCHSYDPLDYKIAEDTILVPDVLIVCGEIFKPYLDFAPALVVEVLSPATALRDRHTKYELYEQQKVPFYLIADPEKETLEIYQLINELYELQPATGAFTFNLEKDCNIDVDFTKIWS